MWQEKQAALLKEEIEINLAPLSGHAGLYELLKEPLSQARRGLADESPHDRPWPLLPLIVCEAISDQFEKALPAAASLQFLMAAGDVFDDVEDADSRDSLAAKYGTALAINAATTLVILAEKALTRLKIRNVNDQTTVRVIDTINSFYITACAGQHFDLSLAAEKTASEETYLEAINMKSASQVECACCVGALIAQASQKTFEEFSLFGHCLGMAAQITNDIQGITRGNDIIRHKINLPIVYALSQSDKNVRSELEKAMSNQYEIKDPAPIRDLLFNIGSIHYSTLKMESYKQQAFDVLLQLQKNGIKANKLHSLLE